MAIRLIFLFKIKFPVFRLTMVCNLLQITFSSDVRVCGEMTRNIKLCNSAKGNVPGTLEEHTPHEGTKTPLNMQ